MSFLIGAYIFGFIGMSLSFGWLSEPAADRLLPNMLCCVLWPFTTAFVAFASIAAALKEPSA